MANLLAGAEAALAGGLFDRRFGDGELLAPAGEELGNVLDGVVRTGWCRGLRSAIAGSGGVCGVPRCALIFVFVGGASPCRTGECARPYTSCAGAPRSQFFE